MAIRKASDVTVDQTRVATDAKAAPTFTKEEMALSAVPSLDLWLGGTTAVPNDAGGTDLVVDGWDPSVNGWRNRLSYEDEIWFQTNSSLTKPTVVDTYDGKKAIRSAATQVNNALLGPAASAFWSLTQPWTIAFVMSGRPTATGLLFGAANPAAGNAYWGFLAFNNGFIRLVDNANNNVVQSGAAILAAALPTLGMITWDPTEGASGTLRFFANDVQIGADWTTGLPAAPGTRLAIFGGVVIPSNAVANYLTGASLNHLWRFAGEDLSKVTSAPTRAALKAFARKDMPSIPFV